MLNSLMFVINICQRINWVSNGSVNGLLPERRQTITWTNADLLLKPLGTNSSEIWIRIQQFSGKKMNLKISPAKWQPFCLGLHVSIPGHDMEKLVWNKTNSGGNVSINCNLVLANFMFVADLSSTVPATLENAWYKNIIKTWLSTKPWLVNETI